MTLGALLLMKCASAEEQIADQKKPIQRGIFSYFDQNRNVHRDFSNWEKICCVAWPVFAAMELYFELAVLPIFPTIVPIVLAAAAGATLFFIFRAAIQDQHMAILAKTEKIDKELLTTETDVQALGLLEQRKAICGKPFPCQGNYDILKHLCYQGFEKAFYKATESVKPEDLISPDKNTLLHPMLALIKPQDPEVRLRMVRHLVEKCHIDLKAKDFIGRTTLEIALRREDEETPFHSPYAHPEIIKYLIRQGIDCHQTAGLTDFLSFIFDQKKETVELLILKNVIAALESDVEVNILLGPEGYVNTHEAIKAELKESSKGYVLYLLYLMWDQAPQKQLSWYSKAFVPLMDHETLELVCKNVNYFKPALDADTYEDMKAILVHYLS